MAKNNENLYYAPDERTITVRVPCVTEEKLEQALDFCAHADQKGDFDWSYLDTEVIDHSEADFFFDDANTAFAFKMRFG